MSKSYSAVLISCLILCLVGDVSADEAATSQSKVSQNIEEVKRTQQFKLGSKPNHFIDLHGQIMIQLCSWDEGVDDEPTFLVKR